jgi:nucleoside-diphosphate-sugar epimerase
MVIVAVAGGTGGVGRALVEAFASWGKHEVYILARKVRGCSIKLDLPLTTYRQIPTYKRKLECLLFQ